MFDRTGHLFALGTFIFSMLLFFWDTGDLIGSITAALLAAGLVWISYVMLVWIYAAIRNKTP